MGFVSLPSCKVVLVTELMIDGSEGRCLSVSVYFCISYLVKIESSGASAHPQCVYLFLWILANLVCA